MFLKKSGDLKIKNTAPVVIMAGAKELGWNHLHLFYQNH